MRFAGFMTTLLALASMLWLGAAPAPTNNPPSPARPPGHQGPAPGAGSDRLSEELKLTDEQKVKVQAVFDEMRTKVQTAILEARTNAETELHRILTPDQYQKLQEMLQQPPPSPPSQSIPGRSTPPRR